jgi:hypothetical protein
MLPSLIFSTPLIPVIVSAILYMAMTVIGMPPCDSIAGGFEIKDELKNCLEL